MRTCYVRICDYSGTCGHQHSTIQKAINCAHPNSEVYRVTGRQSNDSDNVDVTFTKLGYSNRGATDDDAQTTTDNG